MAGQVNAPGNDILSSRDVPVEASRRDGALFVFDQALSVLRSELSQNIPPHNAVPLLNDCSVIKQQMEELIAQIDTVFSLTRAGKFDQLRSQIAPTSHEYDDVLRALDSLRFHLRAQREVYLDEQISGANALQRYEWLLGLLIVVTVIGIAVYGVRLDRLVSASDTQIQMAQERYRLLVEQSTDGILIADDDWNIRFANQAACQMFGYTPQEIIHLNAEHTFLPEDRDLAARRKQQIRTGDSACYERPVLRKDGSRFPAEVVVRRLDQGGSQAIFRDITQRKQTEQSLRETNARLENAHEELQTAAQQVAQQERLSALGTMASGVAHDFNNALTAILGFSELLLDRPELLDDKPKTTEFLEMINTTAKDASNIVNRLREFYRYRDKSEVFAPVNLNHLVEETISLTQPKWKTQAETRGISIRAETDLQEVPPVLGNAAELREALTNLIFNAVDAMPRGGTVTIRTRSHDSRVTLEVADTGSGMTEAVRRRCLEPFFTTKGTYGTGLGLSMVYGIVRRHDGLIDIQTQLDKGSRIILSLPAHRQPQAATESAASAYTPPVSKSVLLVDDDAVVRKVLNEYLIHDGHSVVLAANGKDGLNKFRNGRFDLVILDRAMPDMSGDQVGTAIKGSFPNMPVIMLTGFGSMMEAAGEKPGGVDFVVSKPVTIDALRRAVARAVDLESCTV
jgi:PAS domain S-box-containing protein